MSDRHSTPLPGPSSNFRGTPSATFERILTTAGLARRERQDRAVTIAHEAVTAGKRVFIQASTGTGKSYVALATAADAGRPGAPGIIATTMNSLGDQYLRDCRRAAELAGFTYTRVQGARYYACADSIAARAAGVPGYEALEKDEHGDGDNRDALRAEREAWLGGLVSKSGGNDPATRWELASLGVDDNYRCPGYPECAGGTLGGCGCKEARARSFRADVVITNFHVMAYTNLLGVPLIPLEDAAVVVIDEAHELPGKISEIVGFTIDENTGSRVFRNHPELVKTARAWITSSLDKVEWPDPRSPWSTEAKVAMSPAGMAAFTEAWLALTSEQRDAINGDLATEEGEPGAGDVMSRLRNFAGSAMSTSTWAAWTDRVALSKDRFGNVEAWSDSRKIYLRQVDGAARRVPGMLPAAAVLMTGTVGDTLPARTGLPDAEVHDLGQSFDWTRVRGRISAFSGVKANVPFAQRKVRDQARLDEMASAIRNHNGALVLANAAEDARFIAAHLGRRLHGYAMFVPDRGGSAEAELVKGRYVQARTRGVPAVLVGVDSYATGLDLVGDLCTFVGWWVCVKSAAGYYDEQVAAHFSLHGSFLDERFRARFVQGIGRLLRTPADTGEVFVADARARWHLNRAMTRVDQHLRDIRWSA